jgi:hypothetical protein
MATSTPLWQRLIWVVMFLVVCEGALRKWVLPGLQAEFYLVKDAMLVLAYIGFVSSSLPTGIHLKVMVGLITLLMLTSFFFAVQVFNPNSPSIILSIIGFKNYLLYAPLAFVVPYMFSSSKDLEHKLRKYAIIMIPFAALGLVQFAFAADHWINSYVSHDEGETVMAGFGLEESEDKQRTSGTFSYPGGYTLFLTVMLYLGLGLAASKNWRFSGNLWPWALIVITIAAMFTTGSRHPIYGSVITAPLVLYMWSSRGVISSGNFLKIGLAGMFISIVVAFIASGAIEAYDYRVERADDPIDRVLAPVIQTYGAVVETPIMGTGLASTHGSAATIMGTKDYWWLEGNFYESEPARVWQETGVIGFILVYAARIWLLVKAINLGLRFRTPLYAAMAGVIAGFFAQYLAALNVINNPTAGIYYWFAGGLLFAMYRLELQEATASLPTSASRRQQLRRENGKRRGPLLRRAVIW